MIGPELIPRAAVGMIRGRARNQGALLVAAGVGKVVWRFTTRRRGEGHRI